jgi:hypothetical protein
MKKPCTCTSRPWCDWPICQQHRGKAFIVRLAVKGLLPVAFVEWFIGALGWMEV